MSVSEARGERDILGWTLILCSSLLLGIWAVKGTIALRNSLLGVETLLSIIYCYQFFKSNPKIPIKNWTPLILLGLMFFWVICHYLFLSRFPDQQLHELKSTWFRAFLATVVGLGTGLALLKRPNAINCLWLGILGSFAYLFYQYIPKAMALNSLFAPDYVNYIFYGKISAVLVGTILVAGLLGTMLDTAKRSNWFVMIMVALLTLGGLTIALYVYVFILDARNGVGLVFILLALFCLLILRRIVINILGNLKKPQTRSSRVSGLLLTIFFFLVLGSVTVLSIKEHVKHNPGWSSMWEDTKTSLQIEKYPNWQNPQALGYPVNATGQVVKVNTYERVAWATAGVRIFLPQNPYGLGILKGPFTVLMKESYPNSTTYLPSTHSAWVEIGLAFGYPALFLLLSALSFLGFLSLSSKSQFQATALVFSVGLIALYALGEISSQHAIEMLFFLISLATALLFPSRPKATQDAVKK
jgi:hypothetical protein